MTTQATQQRNARKVQINTALFAVTRLFVIFRNYSIQLRQEVYDSNDKNLSV